MHQIIAHKVDIELGDTWFPLIVKHENGLYHLVPLLSCVEVLWLCISPLYKSSVLSCPTAVL